MRKSLKWSRDLLDADTSVVSESSSQRVEWGCEDEMI